MLNSLLRKPFFIKLLHWEYWSFNTVYGPIIPIWLVLCARARSFFFFSASNPTIMNGGFLMESKKQIYDLLPEGFYPRTLFFALPAKGECVVNAVRTAGLKYPLIAKPDVGGRGRGVRKVNNEEELVGYSQESALDFLVQEYVPFANEVGIFYVRMPGESKGRITGIVSKEFLAVTGDGVHSMRELVMQEKRFILQLPALEIMFGSRLNEVLPAGEKRELVPYGNHARGAKFLDHSHLADEALLNAMDKLCRQIVGFHYGRLDIRFESWDLMKQGKSYSVIELNGAGAEPTHMYDPKHSLFFAWKEIIRHWYILFRISRRNHKKGIPYMSFSEGRRMFRENSEFEKKIARLYV